MERRNTVPVKQNTKKKVKDAPWRARENIDFYKISTRFSFSLILLWRSLSAQNLGLALHVRSLFLLTLFSSTSFSVNFDFLILWHLYIMHNGFSTFFSHHFIISMWLCNDDSALVTGPRIDCLCNKFVALLHVLPFEC